MVRVRALSFYATPRDGSCCFIKDLDSDRIHGASMINDRT